MKNQLCQYGRWVIVTGLLIGRALFPNANVIAQEQSRNRIRLHTA
jgi:hypothetical protein